MGRPERLIDPAAGPVAAFATELRKLRDEAGRPSYRDLARRANFSAAVLAEAAGGRSFPTLGVVRAYVRACGADVSQWEERWQRAADERRQQRPGAPYLGLASYEADQASLFFGREALTGDLLRRLAATRFLAVFGPSGIGKSSLLRAGLLAAVDRGELTAAPRWVTVLCTPGEAPLEELAARIAAAAGIAPEPVRAALLAEPADLPGVIAQALAGLPAGAEVLLVVDQFEELFTVCRDPGQRDRFVRALLAGAAGDGARARVALGVRADFYGHCVTWPELVTALGDAQVLVGPMSHDQLRDVIIKPAGQAGMTVEGALISTALAEAGSEPGALALVSHALLETWRRSPPGRLTLAAYTEAGGVSHAIAETAERVFADCGEGQRPMFRRIMLRLVTVDDATFVRRQATLDELAADGDPAATAALVEQLVQARLLSIDDDSVQLAHEALIRFWPRLAEWLADSRDSLRVQRRVAAAAAQWDGLGRDPAALYRGALLAVARAWADRDAHVTGMTSLEDDFLVASEAAEEAGRVAAIRGTRRLRRLVAGLAAALVAVSVAGGIAAWQREVALSARSAAVSGQLAAQSAQLASVNPDAATLAALAAWNAGHTVTALSALLSTAACCAATQARLLGDNGTVSAVALSPDGRLVAAGGQDRAVHLWTAADGRQFAVLRGFAGPVNAVAFSPRGSLVAAGSADHTIRLWNAARPTGHALFLRGSAAVEDLAFSPDGAVLAAANADGTISLWNPATGRSEQTLRAHGGRMQAVAFSPDGGTLVAAGAGRIVMLWNVTAAPPHVTDQLTGATAAITRLAYGPRGQFAAQEANGRVLLWPASHARPFLLRQPTTLSRGLAFSRDGTVLITAGSSFQIQLWNTATGQLIASDPADVHRFPDETNAIAYNPGTGSLALAGTGTVQFWQAPISPFSADAGPVVGLGVAGNLAAIASVGGDNALYLWTADGSLRARRGLAGHPAAVAVSPGGTSLAVAGTSGGVIIYGLPGLAVSQRLNVPGPVAGAAYSPDGALLAIVDRATVSVWDLASGKRIWRDYSGRGYLNTVAFSPDGTRVTTVSSQGSIRSWDARTGRQFGGGNPEIGSGNAVAVSPDGRLLATAGNDGNIVLWDSGSLRRVARLAGPVGSIRSLVFSPDGRLLASGEGNGTILLWNTASRTLAATLTEGQAVNALAFTAGNTLISGDSSGRIIAWDLNPDDVIRQDCRILAHDPGLTQAETLVTQAETLVPGVSYARLCPS
jgi:WD40 repeat protein